jgi:hypothetical protein
MSATRQSSQTVVEVSKPAVEAGQTAPFSQTMSLYGVSAAQPPSTPASVRGLVAGAGRVDVVLEALDVMEQLWSKNRDFHNVTALEQLWCAENPVSTHPEEPHLMTVEAKP